MSHDELNVNVTMYQDEGHNGQPLPESIGGTTDDRMDIACAIGADLNISIGTALCIAERILLSRWRQKSLMHAWQEGHDAPESRFTENPYL